MLKKFFKYAAGVCLAGTILLGIQGESADAACISENVIESQELKYVKSLEGYTFDSMQNLDNGIVMVRYEKEGEPTSEIMPLTQSITKTALIRFYYDNELWMEFSETSHWAYGGAVGTTPYFGSASYSARYVNTNVGITSWGTPSITGLKTSTNRAEYYVRVSIMRGAREYVCVTQNPIVQNF